MAGSRGRGSVRHKGALWVSEFIKTQCNQNADAVGADARQCFEVQWAGERTLRFILSVKKPLTADMIGCTL